MSEFESFPSQEDWQDLWDEMESDVHKQREAVKPEARDFGPPIEPDWESLLSD